MKKKSKKKNKNMYDNRRFILVFTMMLCLVISMTTYWLYAYNHKYGRNYYEDKIISHRVSDYVTTKGNYVYLKNISNEINDTFVNKQKEILKNEITNISITKGVYKKILSIKISYILKDNTEEVLTLNVNLKDNKELDNDSILDIVGSSYKEIAIDIFSEYIKVDNNKKVIDSITDKELSSSEFNNNSYKYIIRIRELLPDIINIYIENDKVYYLVEKEKIDKVCYYTDINIGYINKEIGKI